MLTNYRQLAATLAVLGIASVSGSAQQVVTMGGGGQSGLQVLPGGPLGGPPPTPDKPLEKGTGIIFGRTVEAGSARPVPGTLVTLSFPGAIPVRVMTDPQGQFAFTSLPKGRYSLSATRPGYVDGAYGRVRPSGSSQSIDLTADQKLTGITIPLWKFAAIAGAVLDERGEPVVGATVRALKRSFSSGRRQLDTAAMDTTDDRGQYRIGSLEPGEYVLVVPVTQSSSLDAMLQGMGLPRDLVGSLPSGGGAVAFSSTVRVSSGGSGPSIISLGTDSGIAPAGKTEDGHLLTYQTEFYPGVLSGSRASAVSVGVGEERSGIDFQLKPVRAVSVSGTLIGPDGPATNTSVSLIPAEADDVVTSIETAAAMTDGKGDFKFADVPPGSYTLRVLKSPRLSFGPGQSVTVSQGDTFVMQTVRSASASGPAPPLPTEPTLWAEAGVAVGSSDLTGLAVSLRSGLRVSGRVEFTGAAAQPAADQLPAISIALEPADGRTAGLASVTRGRVETSGRFTTVGVPAGKYVLRVGGAPKGWALLGASFAGKDITSSAVELKGDEVDGVVITFTDRPADLSGTVTGANGPDAGAAVILFPTDPANWVGTGSAPRNLKSARASDTGAYSFSNVPPGDYYVAAVSDALAADWQNPEFLTALARTAQRIRISEGDKQTQALRTTTVPGRLQ